MLKFIIFLKYGLFSMEILSKLKYGTILA